MNNEEVMLGHLNRIMPAVGVLIAASIALLQKRKNTQLGVGEKEEHEGGI